MGDRITLDNVREAVRAYERALKAVGMIGEEYSVGANRGDSRGISWSLYKVIVGKPYEGSSADVPGVNLDGCYTTREVWVKLTTATYALDAVAEHNRKEAERQPVHGVNPRLQIPVTAMVAGRPVGFFAPDE
jgi:hypothetical protein